MKFFEWIIEHGAALYALFERSLAPRDDEADRQAMLNLQRSISDARARREIEG
jgi:hypothetical protein